MTFRLLSRSEVEHVSPVFGKYIATRVEYEAAFWEGPIEAGQQGKRVVHRCADEWTPEPKVDDRVIPGRFLNTAPSVNYYSALRKAARV